MELLHGSQNLAPAWWLTWDSGRGWREWIPTNTESSRKKESDKTTMYEWKKLRGGSNTNNAQKIFMDTYAEEPRNKHEVRD